MTTSNFLAILYADIFDFPLTEKELIRWAIKAKNQEHRNKGLGFIIKEKDGFYFLKEREGIINLRKKKEEYSEEKIKIAKKAANLLKIVPTIKMVAITGALAMKNTDKDDDIDFLIVSSAGNLWTTRFLTTLLVELTGRRRHPTEKNIRDKICLNMFLDEDYLSVPENGRNLYTAHEVVQLMPLWDRDGTYLKFLKENEWAREYLPNSIKYKQSLIFRKFENKVLSIRYKKNRKEFFLVKLLEKMLKQLQLWYMRKRKTIEKISDGIIKFHPEDKTKWVLKEYNKRVKRYFYYTNLNE